MAEPIFMRIKRLISGSVEEAVDALERAGGVGVMRESIREIDRLVDEANAERGKATTKRLQAMRQGRLYSERLAALQEKAEFAVEQGRDDLAEAALQRQIDFETTMKTLEQTEAEAGAEERQIEEAIASLNLRKARMEEELKAFEAAKREANTASLGGEDAAGHDKHHRVDRAEAAFSRAMAGAGGVAGVAALDTATHAKLAEIETIQRSDTIAKRMEAIRAKKVA
jgi:phage shock protein A